MATFDDFIRALRRIEREALGRRNMQRIGDVSKNIIFKRIKLGFGVDDDKKKFPKKKKLAKLADSTKEKRRKLKKKGELTGSFASPVRSNLTETGQFLDSFKVINAKFGSVEVIIPKTSR